MTILLLITALMLCCPGGLCHAGDLLLKVACVPDAALQAATRADHMPTAGETIPITLRDPDPAVQALWPDAARFSGLQHAAPGTLWHKAIISLRTTTAQPGMLTISCPAGRITGIGTTSGDSRGCRPHTPRPMQRLTPTHGAVPVLSRAQFTEFITRPDAARQLAALIAHAPDLGALIIREPDGRDTLLVLCDRTRSPAEPTGLPEIRLLIGWAAEPPRSPPHRSWLRRW